MPYYLLYLETVAGVEKCDTAWAAAFFDRGVRGNAAIPLTLQVSYGLVDLSTPL
jgi:hypothetical protein